MQTYEVTVTVEALKEDADLNCNDREDSPVGDHQFFIDSDHEVEAVAQAVAIERALDQFHASVPIKVLEDFEIDAQLSEKSAAEAGPTEPWPFGRLETPEQP